MKRNTIIQEYVPALDGLRGLAILLVMGCHFFINEGIFRLGWIGVDLFFVLSGFLIASKFIRQPMSIGLVKVFYRNRILRILPLYFAFIFFFIALWYLIPTGRRVLMYIPAVPFFWLRHFFLLQNWMYVASPTNGQLYNPLMHLWSIAVEEQFYIFFPLIILLMCKLKRKIMMLIGLIFLIAFLRSTDLFYFGLLNDDHSIVNNLRYGCNTIYRLDTFLAGILLAYLVRDFFDYKYLDKIFSGLFFVCLAGYLFMVIYENNLLSDNPLIISAGYTLIAGLFMALLYFVIRQRYRLVNRIFSSRFLVFSGKISYGLYIFHLPFDFYKNSLLNSSFKFMLSWGNEKLIRLFFSCFLIGVVYLVSWVSYTWYESYFLNKKRRYSGMKQGVLAT